MAYTVAIPAGGELLGISLAETEAQGGHKMIELRRIDPLGRAANCGLILRSRIVTVNGKDVSSWPLTELTQCLRSFAGSALSLTLEPPELWKAERTGHKHKSGVKVFADWVRTGPSRALIGAKAALVSKPSWNKSFGTAIRLLKAGAYAVPRDVKAIRLVTDNAIPKILLPKGVKLLHNYPLVPPQPGWPKGLRGEVYVPIPRTKVTMTVATNPPSSSQSSMKLSLAVSAGPTTLEEDKRDFLAGEQSPCTSIYNANNNINNDNVNNCTKENSHNDNLTSATLHVSSTDSSPIPAAIIETIATTEPSSEKDASNVPFSFAEPPLTPTSAPCSSSSPSFSATTASTTTPTPTNATITLSPSSSSSSSSSSAAASSSSSVSSIVNDEEEDLENIEAASAEEDKKMETEVPSLAKLCVTDHKHEHNETNNTDTNNWVAEPHAAIILYIHGGAYCCCGSNTHRRLLSEIALTTRARIFALDYRRPPKHPFPAARDDVCLFYMHMVNNLGVPPKQLILAGDSAGGGLVVSALVHLRDQGAPLPAGAVLLSPWVQLGDFDRPSWKHNALIDYLPRDLAEYFANAYAGKHDLNDPNLSPIYADLRALPPLLVEVGECEVLLDQIVAFCGYAQAAGVNVQLTVSPEMVHVFQLLTVVACRKRCKAPFLSMTRIETFISSMVS